MKKSLFIALTIAAGAATAAPYYLPTTDYTRDLPPRRPSYDSSAPYSCPDTPAASTTSSFGIEIGGNYTYMYEGLEVDTYGFDITGTYNINSNWSVNLRFSWANGDETYIGGEYLYDLEVTNWSITPGIRYTAAISDSVYWFAGANVGYGSSKGDEDWTDLLYKETGNNKDTAGGVTYTIETGLRFKCSDTCYLYGAVQYWGTTATPGDSDELSGEQQGINFRIGMGCSF